MAGAACPDDAPPWRKGPAYAGPSICSPTDAKPLTRSPAGAGLDPRDVARAPETSRPRANGDEPLARNSTVLVVCKSGAFAETVVGKLWRAKVQKALVPAAQSI